MPPEERIGPEPSLRNRIIDETAALEVQAVLGGIENGVYRRDEVRVHTNLPVKMLAVDGSVALLPLAQRDTTPVGVLVHESAVLDGLLALFEYLSLLLSGLSDEAIAMHRRTSVRTVQRRVRALMRSANVHTRMQLAGEAARLGLA